MNRTFKKALALCLAVIMVLSAAPLGGLVDLEWSEAGKASAYNEDLDGYYDETFTEGDYTYAIVDGVAVVASVDRSLKGSVVVPSTFGNYPVKVIGYSAFTDCDHIITVVIPEGVTTIEDYAFSRCDNLMSVTIPDSVTEIGSSAFNECTGLISVEIPEGITAIADSLFCECENLIEVKLPSTLLSIGDSAFSYCKSLTSIEIPDKVTEINTHAFYECTSLSRVVIGRSVEYIGYYTFAYCYCLSQLTMYGSLKSIDSYAFYECSGLTEVVLPEGLKTIGYEAFAYCNKLNKVTVPSTVQEIDVRAFGCCRKLENITVAESNANYCDIDGVLYSKDKAVLIQYPSGKTDAEYTVVNEATTIGESAFRECVNLETVIFLENLDKIMQDAFYSADKLKTVTFTGAAIDSIGEYAFAYCDDLESINIPDGLKTIPYECFYESGIKEITIPDSVETIDQYAFAWSDLEEITLNEELRNISEYAFYSCELKKVTIPSKVISIKKYAFRTRSLKKITVDERNEYFSSDESGTLFNKEKTILVQYPIGNERKEFKIPGTVLRIKDGAFTDCGDLRVIVIPEGVSNIGANAFERCYGLTDITIPATVTGIGYQAFSSCNNLADVYYGGSQEDWSAITVSEENDCLSEARIHFNFGVDHSYTVVKKQRPTCGDWGVYAYSCTCGYEYEKAVPPEGEHVWNEWLVENSPSCEYSGEEYRRCEACGNYEYREIPALGGEHNWGEWIRSWFYCSDGGEDYRYCSICNYTDYRYVEASGEHEFGEWELKRAATCGRMGKEQRVCAVCSFIDERYLPTIGEHIWTEWYDHEPATCTQRGQEHRYCTVCEEYEYQYIDPLGGEHEWQEWVFSWGSCVNGGEEERSCSKCNAFEYRDLTITGEHQWQEWEIQENATCTDVGEKYRECAACDAYEYDEIPALGGEHSWGDEEIDSEATCTGWGYGRRTCDICNDEQWYDIEPTGHSFDRKVFDEVNNNWYHICHCGAAEGGKIIKDTDNGVDILFPENPDAELEVEVIDDEDDETYMIVEEQFGSEGIIKLYDINLVNGNGNFIQPNGTAKVKLPHDGRAGNYKVYRVNPDGTYTDMNAVVENDKITFLSNHFSYYVLVDADLCTNLPETDPDDHAHYYNEEVTSEPTCTEKGIKTFSCNCGRSYTEEITALGHNEIILNAVAATCTTSGLTEGKACQRCQEVLVAQKTIPASGHDMAVSEELSVAPTCKEAGKSVKVCASCDLKEEVSLPADENAHKFEWTNVTATCTQKGSRTGKCSVCAKTETQEIAALGHDIADDEWVVVNAATCSTQGDRVAVCNRCRATVKEKIPTTAHKDENKDNKCDVCGSNMNNPVPTDPPTTDPSQPSDPNTPDNPVDSCDCGCHKGGIAGFFARFIIVFQKLFGRNLVCKCGESH